MRKDFLSRSRKFNPENLFLSVLHLASSTNGEGYACALHRTWQKSGLKLQETPSKSSLSEYRDKVSSEFFRDTFNVSLRSLSKGRKRFRGHYVYAIDGDQLDLPASEDVLKHGYRGASFTKGEETHYPKMYTAQAVDLINGVVMDFRHSNEISEVHLARAIARELEKDSITLYDRFYCHYETAFVHWRRGSYFFARVSHKNPTLPLAIQDFCSSKRRSQWIQMHPPRQGKDKSKPSLMVRFIRVKNKKSKGEMIFMTNMSEGLIRNKEAGDFYQRRWGIENSFKDLTDTLKMCHWHSLKINGILQEIYALLWLVNNVRRLIAGKVESSQPWLKPQYRKANFKLIAVILVDHLELLIKGRYRTLNRILKYWIDRSAEFRTHLARSYPRQVKRFGKQYVNASRVPRRGTAG